MTPLQELEEIQKIASATNAAPADTLRKCNALTEDRVQDRINAGDTELQARRHVLSGRDPIAARLYKLACDLGEQMAYQNHIFLG